MEAIKNHSFLDNLFPTIKTHGEVRWIDALGQTEYDPEGIYLWMIGICLDITERREMQLKYRELVQNSCSYQKFS